MKTAKQWFELLPPDIRDKAIGYTRDEFLTVEYDSFFDALTSSFIFDGTSEEDGPEDYWWDIANDPKYK